MLKFDVFPDFYQKYSWSSETEEPDCFIGRKHYFHNFWINLCGLTGNGNNRVNKAFIGQRKLGKTAFLKRCYNLTFWEQDEVIPFYYCFPQAKEMNLREIAHKIALTFLKQAIGFITKEQDFLFEEEEEVLFYLLEEKNYPWLKKLKMYWDIHKRKTQEAESSLVLNVVWKLIPTFAGLFKKKSLLIIDEYQKTYDSLWDNGKSFPLHESINEIANNMNIFTIVSGSQIGMLMNKVMTSELSNRIPPQTFSPLLENEALDLIDMYVDGKGYDGIEHDVYKLVGGNPFYIKILFTTTEKFFEYHQHSKTWATPEELKESFTFEVLHHKGEIFLFWQNHLRENRKHLNGDKKENKGLTLRILKFIAEKKERATYPEIKKAFPKLKDIRKKMIQLREADFVYQPLTQEVYNFSDAVLPLVLTRIFQEEILGDLSEEAFIKEQERLLEIREQNIQAQNEMHSLIFNIKKDVSLLQKQHKTSSKKQNTLKKHVEANKKGLKAQQHLYEILRKQIQGGKGLFCGYQLKNNIIKDTHINFLSGGGCQVDVYCELQSLNGTQSKEFAIIGESKSWKGKVGSGKVKDFIESIGIVKRDNHQKDSISFFAAKSGFTKPAEQLLKQHRIFFGTPENVIEQLEAAQSGH